MSKYKSLKNNLIGDKCFYLRVIAILVPIVIQNTVTNVVSLVDNVMVGAVGTLQMSAVAIVNQLLFVFYLCIFGGLAGAGIFATQYAGAKDNDGVRYCFRIKIYTAFFMLAAALLIFGFLPDKLISMYLSQSTSASDASATLGYGIDYMAVMIIGLLPFSISQVYGSTLRELGETKVPMLASVAAIAVNLSLNYVLIFGNEGFSFLPFAPLGVVGAASATVISRFVEAIIIVAFVHIKSGKFQFIKGAYKSLKIPVELCKKIVIKGSPLLINEFLWSLGTATIMQCYSVRGLEVVAASNIATTAANLFNVIFISMGNAIAIMVGQHLGANEIEKAKTAVWRLLFLSLVTCVIMGGITAAAAPFIPLIYNTTDTVCTMATQFLWVFALVMPMQAFSHGCYFTIRSGGKTLVTMIFDCVFMWCVSVSTAYVLANFTQLPIIPLYATVQFLEAIKCVIGFILIKKGIWINNIVEE